jgi:hypothetical protein
MKPLPFFFFFFFFNCTSYLPLIYNNLEHLSFACSVEAAGVDAAPVGKSPPKASLPHLDEPSRAFEDVPTNQLMEKLSLAAAHQATLVAQLKARHAGEGSSNA